MATITTTTYLDDAARTAGEAMTINGGRLIVRTDTRWHAHSPASMTGSLGAVTISTTLGGGYELDGTKVRQLHYTSGTGNVPAVGTVLTGGTSGATGILLGFWAGDTSAPTAVGAAVPATGYIKFREVTGAFTDAETVTGGGITCDANDTDRVSWIEVVHDQAIAISVPRLGDFKVRGDWYVVGTTSGAANQILQLPTNGSTTTYVPGVWVATTGTPSGPEDYEFWPAVYAAGMSTANYGTDVRSSVVLMGTDGTIRFGHNGTTTVGYVPPAGRQVRVPNVFGRQCATGTRATNAFPHATLATRPDFTTTSAGSIDVEHFLADWYMLFSQPYSVKLHHVATFDTVSVSECATPPDIYDGGNGSSAATDTTSLLIGTWLSGGTVDKWYARRMVSASSDYCVHISNSSSVVISRCTAAQIARSSSAYCFYVVSSQSITLENCRVIFHGVYVTACKDVSVIDLDYTDRYVGTTSATGGVYAVTLFNTPEFLVDGMTTGFGGAVANCHPYSGLVTATTSQNGKVRNIGTAAAPLSGGSSNSPGYLFAAGSACTNIKVQRCYLQPTRTALYLAANDSRGIQLESVFGDFADALAFSQLNGVVKGCAFTFTTSGQSSVYGTHWFDHFGTSLIGAIGLCMNEPTAETASVYTVVSGTPRFTSAGTVILATVGDEAIWEMPYFAVGHDSLYSATVTGTNAAFSSGSRWGNYDIYFQIDKGAGYGGSWIDFNAANVLANGTGVVAGVKLKVRIVCATAATNNIIINLRFLSTTSDASMQTYLYPLDTNALTLTGLKNPSEVRVYDAANPTGPPIAGQENVTSGTFTASIDAGTYPEVIIAVLSLGYQNLRYVGIDMSEGDVEIPVFQSLDRQYLNP